MPRCTRLSAFDFRRNRPDTLVEHADVAPARNAEGRCDHTTSEGRLRWRIQRIYADGDTISECLRLTEDQHSASAANIVIPRSQARWLRYTSSIVERGSAVFRLE